MLFELAVAGGVLYFGLAGHGVRESARLAGRFVGRATGGLRRARAASEQLQARAEAIGGAELRDSRREIAERMLRLRNIQQELAALTSVGGGAPLGAGAAPPPVFSDEELAEAVASAPHAAAAPQTRDAVAPPVSAVPQRTAAAGVADAPGAPQPLYFINGRPVFAATFEAVFDAGSSVPRAAADASGAGSAGTPLK